MRFQAAVTPGRYRKLCAGRGWATDCMESRQAGRWRFRYSASLLLSFFGPDYCSLLSALFSISVLSSYLIYSLSSPLKCSTSVSSVPLCCISFLLLSLLIIFLFSHSSSYSLPLPFFHSLLRPSAFYFHSFDLNSFPLQLLSSFLPTFSTLFYPDSFLLYFPQTSTPCSCNSVLQLLSTVTLSCPRCVLVARS